MLWSITVSIEKPCFLEIFFFPFHLCVSIFQLGINFFLQTSMALSSKAIINNDENTFNGGNTSAFAINNVNNGISQCALSLQKISSQISLTFILVILGMKLTRNKYGFWRLQNLTTIRAYGLERYLYGNKTCPPRFIKGQINPNFFVWLKIDQLIMSWLLASIL